MDLLLYQQDKNLLLFYFLNNLLNYLLNLDSVEDVELSFDQVGVITLMPPESPRLKEKVILYCDKIDDYNKIKKMINNNKLMIEDILGLL